MSDIRDRLRIDVSILDEINEYLLDPSNPLVNSILEVLDKYGGIEEINEKARENGKVENLMARLGDRGSPYADDLLWLIEKRDSGAFITEEEYRRNALGERYEGMTFTDDFAVTLELSAGQYFPWFMKEARLAVERRELLPGRYIRVRNMAEQVKDDDLLAFSAAMKIIGSSICETLDTRGTDGSNVHLGGPETITGYFGGVGQPNHYAVKWLDEFLRYYTNYGVKQVLNVNPGTVLLGYMLYKLGVDIEFKISVYLGNDNPFGILWTLLTARLLSRDDGTTSLIGFNFSNSVNNDTIELSAEIRRKFGLEDVVRFEHHILETHRSIVRQPYDRREELLELATKVKNMSAKHEGGEIEVELKREHPSDIVEYFLTKEDIEKEGLWPHLERNFLDKHDSINNTARALTERGLSFVAARNLHHR